MPAFPDLKFAFLNNPIFLILIFVIFSVFYFTISAVLMYHWRTYGMQSKGIMVGRILFLSVSVGLFGVSLLSFVYL